MTGAANDGGAHSAFIGLASYLWAKGRFAGSVATALSLSAWKGGCLMSANLSFDYSRNNASIDG